MGLTVFDIVLVGWDLQHKELNCQHWEVTTKRERMFQCFLLVAKNEIKTLLKMKEKDLSTEHRNQSTHLGSCDPPERNESQPE